MVLPLTPDIEEADLHMYTHRHTDDKHDSIQFGD